MKKIKFGIVGRGKIVENFLEAAKSHKDFELVAVYSRNLEEGKTFGEKYGAKLFFDDFNEFAKCDLIDAVYIATPNYIHFKQGILCLENKKHVLCEKPMASNYKEVLEMINKAKENDVLLMEAMRPTTLPNFLSVKENLYKIGKVRRYFASYCQYSSRYDKYKEGIVLNAFKKELSNGSLMDIGVYCIHPMVSLFGMPKRVLSEGVFLESGVDGEGSAMCNYESFNGVIMYSKISDSKLPLEIQGENGTILIDGILFKSAKIIYRNGEEEDISVYQREDDMYYEIDEFINLIHENRKESTLNSYENSLNAIKVMDKIREEIGLIYPADLK